MIHSIEAGRKEDGNRSIADKIIKRLHDLNKTVENNQGRWAWELLQNAKDSIAEEENRTVSIQLVLDENQVEFSHDGTHFTEQDVRGIINQISSKEIEEGQSSKKTGRFGTGFLTTHLLSKVISIKGILESADNKYYTFKFPLDREGKTTAQLIPKIEKAWEKFHESAVEIDGKYDRDALNTSFTYTLETADQQEIAQIGVNEFVKLIPFVLAFIPKIAKVEIKDNTTSKHLVFKNSKQLSKDGLISISKIENRNETKIPILYATDDFVEIAAMVEETERGFVIKSNEEFPKLFCDFPLIGTETFYFPVVVNSFHFHPQTERDGVWLKAKKEGADKEVQENQEILERAVAIYSDLITQVSNGSFFDLFNISDSRTPKTDTRYLDDSWFATKIQKPLRETIFNATLVEQDDKDEKRAIKNLWFPIKSLPNEKQARIWNFIFDLVPGVVCKEEHLLEWNKISWDSWRRITPEVLANTVAKRTSMKKLSEDLGVSEDDAYDWINHLGVFLLEDAGNHPLFEKCPIIPDKNGLFKKRSLLNIDEIEDDGLIEILILLGEDWREILINDRISFGEYNVKDKKAIASKITEKLKNFSGGVTAEFRNAIVFLSEWFENNGELGKSLFAEIYKKKAELFMNTIEDKDSLYKIMRSKADFERLSKVADAIEENPQLLENVQQGNEIAALLKDFNATTLAELKQMLILAKGIAVSHTNLEFTQDTLVSLGVTSMEDLEEALKDVDFASNFNHTSKPNVEMFIYVQTLISRAKENIMAHLKTLPEYDCNDIEDLAPTVVGGVKKQGLPIHIVVRPSDNGQVILYYSSEKDTLDFANSELWIDNGIDKPKQLTLGKILKNIGINKIPV